MTAVELNYSSGETEERKRTGAKRISKDNTAAVTTATVGTTAAMATDGVTAAMEMPTATAMAAAEIPMIIVRLVCASTRVTGITGHMTVTQDITGTSTNTVGKAIKSRRR